MSHVIQINWYFWNILLIYLLAFFFTLWFIAPFFFNGFIVQFLSVFSLIPLAVSFESCLPSLSNQPIIVDVLLYSWPRYLSWTIFFCHIFNSTSSFEWLTYHFPISKIKTDHNIYVPGAMFPTFNDYTNGHSFHHLNQKWGSHPFLFLLSLPVSHQ